MNVALELFVQVYRNDMFDSTNLIRLFSSKGNEVGP